MTTRAVNVQCQSFIAANKGYGWGEHSRCQSPATLECRDNSDPEYVRYLCDSCMRGLFLYAPYDYRAHGVVIEETHEIEDRWPAVAAQRVYRRIEPV